MAVMIDNNNVLPDVAPGQHVVEILGVRAKQMPKFDDKSLTETRLCFDAVVRTPGHKAERFAIWTSTSLKPGARLGQMVKAALGTVPDARQFDAEALIGCRLKGYFGTSESGYPTLFLQSALPVGPNEPVNDLGDQPLF